jgi:HD superfamily phosphodiesterase
LAEKYGANAELAQAAAMLHDIADSQMSRKDPRHEAESLELARELMTEISYPADEISLVVDDAIRYHSCRGDERPKSKEGLTLATADSLAHLQTDFYIYATWAYGKDRSLEALKEWALKKIDRDLSEKIAFEDERQAARTDHDMLKALFSR